MSRRDRSSARERALRAAAAAAGAAFEEDAEPAGPDLSNPRVRSLFRKKVANLAAGRGDVIKIGKHRAVVLTIDWRDPSWALSYRLLIEKGSRLSTGDAGITFQTFNASPPEKIGRWIGDLEPGSRGYVGDPVPSDGPRSTEQTRTTTNASKEAKEDATMATVVKRSTKKGSTAAKGGTASKKGGTAAKSTTKTTTAKAGGGSRRTQADVDALVPKFRRHLQGGGTMRALKQEFGFSDDGPIRSALYRAGFDSKGAEHGESANSINPKNKTGREKVLKLRSEGAGWYRLAFLTGMTESEVKAFVAEHGGSTSRVYRASEKPAKASGSNGGKSAGKSEDDKVKAESSARKGSGKKVTRRAVKADPSK